MCSKLTYVVSIVLMFCLIGTAAAADFWWGGEGLWSDGGHWNQGGSVPSNTDVAGINSGTCLIDSTVAAECNQMRGPGWTGGEGLATLNITGGTLTIGSHWWFAVYGGGDGTGVVNISGGQVTVEDHMVIGQASTGTLNMTGGTITVTQQIDIPWANALADSYINLDNGVLESLNSGLRFRGQGLETSAYSGHLDIKQGILRVNGDWITGGWPINYTDAITQGLITAYDGEGRVEMIYDSAANKTILKGIHPLEPNPADGTTASASVNELSWILPDPNLPGGVVTCDVYFGTNPDVETNAKVVTRQAVESVSVALAPLMTYYWAIDIYDSSTVTTNPIILSPVFTFNTKNLAPVVYTGEDVFTWLTAGTVDVSLDGMVSDDGTPEPYTVLWTVLSKPEAGAATLAPPSANQEDLTVTLSATGQYMLRLEANDGELTGADTITINVFEDACQAAKATPGFELLAGDFDEDCDVDWDDFAVFADNWLGNNSL